MLQSYLLLNDFKKFLYERLLTFISVKKVDLKNKSPALTGL